MAAMGNIAATAAIGTTMGAGAIPASTTAMGVAAASVFPPAGAHTAATCRTAVHTGQFTAAMLAAALLAAAMALLGVDAAARATAAAGAAP